MRIILLCLMIITACQAPEAQSNHAQFLDMDSLVEAQASALIGYGIRKDIQVNDSLFKNKETQGAINWRNELEIFSELNQFNLPIHRGEYTISEKKDSKSNLIIRSWTAKNELPLRSFKLYVLPFTNQVKRIEADIMASDFYYDSDRKLALEFSLLGAGNLLESYHISGTQKYFWAPQESFSVTSKIIH